MTYSEIIQSLSINIAETFGKVYHSAEIIQADDKFPGVPTQKNWINLAPTDIQEGIYIRRNGDDEVQGEESIASCVKSYKMRSQLRIVFFKDNTTISNHSEILFKLMQSVLISGTKLNKIIRDKYKLLKDESSGEYTFGPTAAYFAIDIYALWNLLPDRCEQDFCVELENPLCHES